MMHFKNQRMTGDVLVDNCSFEDCTFGPCTLHYSGASFEFLGTTTTAGTIGVTFTGAAFSTIEFLKVLRLLGADKGEQILLQLISLPEAKVIRKS